MMPTYSHCLPESTSHIHAHMASYSNAGNHNQAPSLLCQSGRTLRSAMLTVHWSPWVPPMPPQVGLALLGAPEVDQLIIEQRLHKLGAARKPVARMVAAVVRTSTITSSFTREVGERLTNAGRTVFSKVLLSTEEQLAAGMAGLDVTKANGGQRTSNMMQGLSTRGSTSRFASTSAHRSQIFTGSFMTHAASASGLSFVSRASSVLDVTARLGSAVSLSAPSARALRRSSMAGYSLSGAVAPYATSVPSLMSLNAAPVMAAAAGAAAPSTLRRARRHSIATTTYDPSTMSSHESMLYSSSSIIRGATDISALSPGPASPSFVMLSQPPRLSSMRAMRRSSVRLIAPAEV